MACTPQAMLFASGHLSINMHQICLCFEPKLVL
jgi:hypothetical protein